MGKGDKKSRKGKIWKGSYGNSRKRKANKTGAAPVAKVKVETEAAKPKPKAKKAPKKKAAKKKAE